MARCIRLVYLAILTGSFALSLDATFADPLVVGQLPPQVNMSGEMGARTNGDSWSSDELKGAITSLFYVDPDERALNEPLEDAFKKEQFPFDKHHSVAVINMAATWLPNAILGSKLSRKQKDFPQTVFVKDFKSVLLKAWDLKEDSVNTVVLDRDGKVMYVKKGPLDQAEIADLMKLIRAAI